MQPRSAKLHAGAGMALESDGDLPRAQRHYRAALALYPPYAQIRYRLARLLDRLGRRDEAIEEMRRAAELTTGNVLPHRALIGWLESGGRRSEALEVYAAALRLAPGDPTLRFGYGRALWEAGRVEESEAVRRSLLADPRLPAELRRAIRP
jgi:tetratricopeptide (TPR) repeat protein